MHGKYSIRPSQAKGEIWEKFQKKLPAKSQALLGLNLMGFTDLIYKQISFHFLQGNSSSSIYLAYQLHSIFYL